jgi:hypothetical protein
MMMNTEIDAQLAELLKDIEAGNARHAHIGEDDVETAVARQGVPSSPLAADRTVWPAERSIRSMLSRTAVSSSMTRIRGIRGAAR